jgi:hypothetical protein
MCSQLISQSLGVSKTEILGVDANAAPVLYDAHLMSILSEKGTRVLLSS